MTVLQHQIAAVISNFNFESATVGPLFLYSFTWYIVLIGNLHALTDSLQVPAGNSQPLFRIGHKHGTAEAFPSGLSRKAFPQLFGRSRQKFPG